MELGVETKPRMGDRVRVVGFTAYPRSVYNGRLATVQGHNEQKGILLVRLETNGDLILLKDTHVDFAQQSDSSSVVTEELHINSVETCAICLSGLAGTPRVQTHCKHVFHETCLRRWCSHNSTETVSCPMCRNGLQSARPHAIVVRGAASVVRRHLIQGCDLSKIEPPFAAKISQTQPDMSRC